MQKFLPQQDELAASINSKAEVLYRQLRAIQIEDLQLAPHFMEYFKTSHFKRLFFSIETSAHLLYRAIRLRSKPASEIAIMDYGAGVGTLFILAKLIGCKKVIYNDLFEDWKTSAQQILNVLGITVDEYIVGDIDATLYTLNNKQIVCDIIASRNVIEHIYKIDVFYGAIRKYQPAAIVISSTTANFYNPGTHLQHVVMHKKYEKIFYQQRLEIIMQILPQLASSAAAAASKKTRGLGSDDLNKVISTLGTTNNLSPVKNIYTNTCDPYNGVWAEHLLTFEQYRKAAGKDFHITFEPGFWDTHYNRSAKNIFSRILNSIIRLNRRLGIILAPFIYVIAVPRREL
jgi:2-polyprenyl-3-methyl-5-hydroxy-6-metoxy-1,4-benzoquinol methylase